MYAILSDPPSARVWFRDNAISSSRVVVTPGLWLHLQDTEMLFLGLGVTITGNYIKKVQKQENKNIRNVKMMYKYQ